MTTKDILYIVLSLSILAATVVVVWFFAYLIGIVRELRKITKSIHEKIDGVGGILESIKERISDSASALSLLTQVVARIGGAWRQRRSKRPRNRGSDVT
ncbi:MAG: hypothetical protein HY420_01800 [Candidatus Kerfeldbacteria bacterium]|nr:hypothetical protein [Candidatus Kerfeldbacteria bacterium]